MNIKTAILVLGIALVIAGISIPAISSQMWWAQPSKIQNGIGIMRPVTSSDQLLISLNKIWPLITLGGIGIILANTSTRFIRKK